MRNRATYVIGLIAAVGLRASAALGAPAPLAPAVATVVDPQRFRDAYVENGQHAQPFIPVALTGQGLRDGNGSSVEIRSGNCAAVIHTITARQRCAPGKPLPCVVDWTDARLVLKLPHALLHAALRFSAGGPCIPIEYYTYEWFPTDSGAGYAGGVPLAMTVDPRHRVWINEEYHRDLKELAPSSNVIRAIPIPSPAVPPFASNLFARDTPTQISVLGEEVVVDPNGRIWFSEGGGFMYGTLYSGDHPNHSRIVMYDPHTAQMRVYNVPGNDNEIMGLAYGRRCTDGTSTGKSCADGTPCPAGQSCDARIWFTETARRAAKFFMERLPGACETLCTPVRNSVIREVLPPRLAWFSAEPGKTPYTTGSAANFDPGVCGIRDRVCANRRCAQDADCTAPCESGVCADGSGRSCANPTDCSGNCASGLCANWVCARDSDCDSTCTAGLCSDHTRRPCTPSGGADCRGLCLTRGTCAETSHPCLKDDDCALERQVCDWSSPRPDCFFREYRLPGAFDGRHPMPDFFQPGHVLVGSDGAIWYTAYGGGNHLGRLTPETCSAATADACTAEIIPLPVPSGTHPAVSMVGAGPWRIVQAPDGDIIFSEFFDNSVSRLHVARLRDPDSDCRRLDSMGRNPCLTEAWIPVANPAAVQVHSIGFDERGRLWFTQSTDVCFQADRTAESSIGYVRYPTPETPEVIVFPPLSLYDFQARRDGCKGDPFKPFVGTGIAVDRATHEIWFGDMLRRRIGRIRPLARDGGTKPRAR